MTEQFKFLEIPDEARAAIGEPDKGTRVYRRDGLESEVGEWHDVLNAFAGPMVSPGGVSMFAPVSRAAVHKRLKEGRLTAFSFYTRETKTGFFGRKRTVRGMPFVYIPVSECKAWAEELKERMIRLGHISKEEIDGEKPDWSNDFWRWNEKNQKEYGR